MRPRMLRRSLICLFLLGLPAGCAPVAAYERGRLAHPTMQQGDNVGAGRSHLHAVQEGAAGASATRTGGCGCN